MSILIVSSSCRDGSRSDRAAHLALAWCNANGAEATLVRLQDYPLPRFDDAKASYDTDTHRELHRVTSQADSLIFASPVYNWSLCSELKRYIEFVGSTSPDASRRGAFFDKVLTLILAAGLPHSYMAAGPVMQSMMLDFRCIINPYQCYLYNDHWNEDASLKERAVGCLERSLLVHQELAKRLKGLSYNSTWAV